MRTHRVIRTAVGLVLAAVSVVGFASTFVFGAALTKRARVSPEVLSFLRFAIAGGAMFAVACARAESRHRLFDVPRADFLRMLWVGPVGTALMACFVFMGCARVSAANASMADALTPLMIFVVGAVYFRRVELCQLFGLVCGLVGALLVIQVLTFDGLTLEAYSFGDVCILLSAATWGFYTVFGHAIICRIGSLAFTVWTMLIGAAALAVVLPWGAHTWPSDVDSWLLVAGLGLVSTLMPFWAWNAAQKFLPMSVLSVTAYFTPVVAVGLALVFLHEAATPLQWCGAFFIVLSAAVECRSQTCPSQ